MSTCNILSFHSTLYEDPLFSDANLEEVRSVGEVSWQEVRSVREVSWQEEVRSVGEVSWQEEEGTGSLVQDACLHLQNGSLRKK